GGATRLPRRLPPELPQGRSRGRHEARAGLAGAPQPLKHALLPARHPAWVNCCTATKNSAVRQRRAGSSVKVLTAKVATYVTNSLASGETPRPPRRLPTLSPLCDLKSCQ